MFSEKKRAISRDYLISWLDYEPESGFFFWKKKGKGKAVLGGIAGHVGPDGYRQIGLDRVTYPAHSLAWLFINRRVPALGLVVDHINGNRDDNRIDNLREVTYAQNNTNKLAWGNSGIKGVSWHKKTQRWRATIGFEGKQLYLGLFDHAIDAAAAYNTKATLLYGDYARFEPA